MSIEPTKVHERVEFKLIHMHCCGHLLCWVNPRYPIFCPECGCIQNQATIRQCVKVFDSGAELILSGKP